MVDLNAKKNKDIKKQTKPNQPGKKKNKKKIKINSNHAGGKKTRKFLLKSNADLVIHC